MLTDKEQKRYVFIKPDDSALIIKGQENLISYFYDSGSASGRYYELGPEIEVKVSVSVKNKTVTRGYNSKREPSLDMMGNEIDD